MAKEKTLYNITGVVYDGNDIIGEINDEYVRAYSETQAKMLILRRYANKRGYIPEMVYWRLGPHAKITMVR